MNTVDNKYGNIEKFLTIEDIHIPRRRPKISKEQKRDEGAESNNCSVRTTLHIADNPKKEEKKESILIPDELRYNLYSPLSGGLKGESGAQEKKSSSFIWDSFQGNHHPGPGGIFPPLYHLSSQNTSSKQLRKIKENESLDIHNHKFWEKFSKGSYIKGQHSIGNGELRYSQHPIVSQTPRLERFHHPDEGKNPNNSSVIVCNSQRQYIGIGNLHDIPLVTGHKYSGRYLGDKKNSYALKGAAAGYLHGSNSQLFMAQRKSHSDITTFQHNSPTQQFLFNSNIEGTNNISKSILSKSKFNMKNIVGNSEDLTNYYTPSSKVGNKKLIPLKLATYIMRDVEKKKQINIGVQHSKAHSSIAFAGGGYSSNQGKGSPEVMHISQINQEIPEKYKNEEISKSFSVCGSCQIPSFPLITQNTNSTLQAFDDENTLLGKYKSEVLMKKNKSYKTFIGANLKHVEKYPYQTPKLHVQVVNINNAPQFNNISNIKQIMNNNKSYKKLENKIKNAAPSTHKQMSLHLERMKNKLILGSKKEDGIVPLTNIKIKSLLEGKGEDE